MASPIPCGNMGAFYHGALREHPEERHVRIPWVIRYSNRSPFAHDQLSFTSDGQVAFALRKHRKNGVTHLFFRPLQLLRRFARPIPRPRVHHAPEG
jgi:hypothetical protein